eukprot:TRINITY_DN8364_c0_g1_i1.p1 TRINITY_DN8364_c0_g1~~TRINITY_DN8364_c0_g1_i1.p1  ORF type:complete len:232 (-),score=8.55 TRINITY_DN8364_c0_g1_i1:71-766(-)
MNKKQNIITSFSWQEYARDTWFSKDDIIQNLQKEKVSGNALFCRFGFGENSVLESYPYPNTKKSPIFHTKSAMKKFMPKTFVAVDSPTTGKFSPEFTKFIQMLFSDNLIHHYVDYYDEIRKLARNKQDRIFTHTELQLLKYIHDNKTLIFANMDFGVTLYIHIASLKDICDNCTYSLVQFCAAELLQISIDQIEIIAYCWEKPEDECWFWSRKTEGLEKKILAKSLRPFEK